MTSYNKKHGKLPTYVQISRDIGATSITISNTMNKLELLGIISRDGNTKGQNKVLTLDNN
jgi:DNA-binding HxlR family transcriptional regulator